MEYVAIRFKENGIKLMAMDAANFNAAHLFISAENLIEYKYASVNIAFNLNALLTVLDMLGNDVTFEINTDRLQLSAGGKTFELGIINLDSDYEYPDFKPKIEWKVNENIEGINRIFTYMDNGPLIINSGQDGYDLRWIVAPNFQSSH